MKRKVLISMISAFTTIAVIASVFGFIIKPNSSEELILNQFSHEHSGENRVIYGLPLYENTFENIVNKYSSHILVGTINSNKPFSNDSSKLLYEVSVQNEVLGEVEDIINVYIEVDNLQVGNRYLLFINEFSSTLYQDDFYVLVDQFIVKVDNNNQLKRLESKTHNIYTDPFVNQKYNDLEKLMICPQKAG